MKNKLILIIIVFLFVITPSVFAQEEDGEGKGNAWGQGGVYCAEGKETVHPLALLIEEKYGTNSSFVMEHVCDGVGFGSVMLAIKMGGGNAVGMLEQRKAGQGWGQIWKEMGLIGKDAIEKAPPGLLKKGDDHPGGGPPEGKGNGNGNGNGKGNGGGNGN